MSIRSTERGFAAAIAAFGVGLMFSSCGSPGQIGASSGGGGETGGSTEVTINPNAGAPGKAGADGAGGPARQATLGVPAHAGPRLGARHARLPTCSSCSIDPCR